MLSWQVALGLLVVAWLLQSAGTIVQIRRFRAAMRELSGEWSDGWLGAGKAGGGLASGAMAMLVASPDGHVRRAVVIRGRTIFAKAERLRAFEGLPLSGFETAANRLAGKATARALILAAEQVRAMRAKRPEATAPTGQAIGAEPQAAAT